jgi:hypothetical protein
MDTTVNADMRIEVVKREINQGALAGFGSAVTDFAASLVIAALDSYDQAALDLAYRDGFRNGFRAGDKNGRLAERLRRQRRRRGQKRS